LLRALSRSEPPEPVAKGESPLGERSTRGFRNELTTLPRYRTLVETVQSMTAPMTTAQLRSAASLDGERDSIVGALWALELSGEVHGLRHDRNRLIWHPGVRTEPTPAKLQKDIAPFEHLMRVLREHGTTPFSTALLMHVTGLTRARALGALKASAALGLLAYRSEPIPRQRNWVIRWWWASATRGWDFEPEVGQVSLDQTIGAGDSRTFGDLVAAGRVVRRTRRGGVRFDSADSSRGVTV
jgi:hypothetical protein